MRQIRDLDLGQVLQRDAGSGVELAGRDPRRSWRVRREARSRSVCRPGAGEGRRPRPVRCRRPGRRTSTAWLPGSAAARWSIPPTRSCPSADGAACFRTRPIRTRRPAASTGRRTPRRLRCAGSRAARACAPAKSMGIVFETAVNVLGLLVCPLDPNRPPAAVHRLPIHGKCARRPATPAVWHVSEGSPSKSSTPASSGRSAPGCGLLACEYTSSEASRHGTAIRIRMPRIVPLLRSEGSAARSWQFG